MAKNALESANMLAWIDLEMTGLDPDLHVIVEIATLITDDQLNLIAEGPDLVISATEEQLKKMDPVVVEMHTKSGLLDEIKASKITLEEAGSQTLSFLMEHIGMEVSLDSKLEFYSIVLLEIILEDKISSQNHSKTYLLPLNHLFSPLFYPSLVA